MRVPVGLAWLLLGIALFTSGLLRQFHDRTPHSPWVPPVVGSLLFAALLFLLLVASREFRRGAVPGKGVRLGSLTPLLLMLFLEKWVSLALYNPIFFWITDSKAEPAVLDAQFRLFAGAGLILVCVLVSGFSTPTARKTWRRARPSRWPVAALQVGLVLGGTYLLLGGAAWALGGSLTLRWPRPSALLAWVVVGQTILALAEELYYRGLLMSECERLAPRLGLRNRAVRRWFALLATSTLFGMEHIHLNPPWGNVARQLTFTIALALLFGLLVVLSANLHYAAGIHAWINWLLLGAAPHFVDATGEPALPAGTYIGVTLMLAFVLGYAVQRTTRRMHSKPRPAPRIGVPG
ncbi:MAG: CPBP family intramembrane metalloprotease [bacterium]|nr:CPBP family intramembrane metalloprotease [bacterium]